MPSLPKIEPETLFFAAMILVGVLFFGAMAADSECSARGLVAGAKSVHDVRMSFLFTCVAEVDGKWVEVK